MNNINLRNFHPSVLGHCWLFLVKNQVFGLLDQIAPKLPQKIKKKKINDQDSLRRDFLILFEKSEKNFFSFI